MSGGRKRQNLQPDGSEFNLGRPFQAQLNFSGFPKNGKRQKGAKITKKLTLPYLKTAMIMFHQIFIIGVYREIQR